MKSAKKEPGKDRRAPGYANTQVPVCISPTRRGCSYCHRVMHNDRYICVADVVQGCYICVCAYTCVVHQSREGTDEPQGICVDM